MDIQSHELEHEEILAHLTVARNSVPEDEPHLLNELKVMGIRMGLWIKVGRTEGEFERIVFNYPCSIRVSSVAKGFAALPAGVFALEKRA